MQDCLRLLHYHLGSQVPDIRRIRTAANEAARFYAELVREGAVMGILDVGGGLAVDYDGSHTNFASSCNYSSAEYAADVLEVVMHVLDESNTPTPRSSPRPAAPRSRITRSSSSMCWTRSATNPANCPSPFPRTHPRICATSSTVTAAFPRATCRRSSTTWSSTATPCGTASCMAWPHSANAPSPKRSSGTRQHLAELHAPLVERVHVPDHALHEDLVLVERDQRPRTAGVSCG
jgi:hypothetical protein